VQGHAPCQLAFIFRQQQSSVRRRIVPGKSGEFLVEVLETEIEAKRSGIFEEKFANLRNLDGGLGWPDRKPRNGTCYPISIPPFTLSTCPVM
jgi:hypothetical protein